MSNNHGMQSASRVAGVESIFVRARQTWVCGLRSDVLPSVPGGLSFLERIFFLLLVSLSGKKVVHEVVTAKITALRDDPRRNREKWRVL